MPSSWIEPRTSLHTILWSAVRSPAKAVRDRCKNVIDPLAVLIMEVHDVHTPFIGKGRGSHRHLSSETQRSGPATSGDSSVRPLPILLSIVPSETGGNLTSLVSNLTRPLLQPTMTAASISTDMSDEVTATKETTVGPPGGLLVVPLPLPGSTLQIPSGEKRLFACLNPDTAGLVMHVRINNDLGRGTLSMWKQVQQDWDGVSNVTRSVADMYRRASPFAQSPSCGHCDCGGTWCMTKANRNVVDFTLVNVYGELLVAELDAFLSSGFHLR